MTQSPSVKADSHLGEDLPTSWALTTLGAVTDYGRTEKVEPENIPAGAWVLELEDIEKDSSRILQRRTQSERQSLSTKNRFDAGDVLYGKLRPYLNKVVIADAPGFCTTEVVPVQPGPALERRYLFHWLKHPAFLKYVEAASHGMNMPRLGTDAGRAAPLILAPRPEQTRIADQLDTLLARIRACQDRLDAIPTLLKRFREAVLASATGGELTADWRAERVPVPSASELRRSLEADYAEAGGHQRGNASEPTEDAHDLSVEHIPSGWEISALRDCCRPGRPITYGILKPGPELEEGVPYIRVADFPGNQLNLTSIRRTSPEIDLLYRRARLSTGDLLLSIRGSVGRIVVIPPSLDGANITQDTARLSISARLNARYVYYALLSPDAQRRMANATRGVAVRGINIGDVRALQVPLPSLEEQDEIVRRIDALFEIAKRIESNHGSAQKQVGRLMPLTLSKAFRGELVSQDPSDEPASALLARITAERSAPTSSRRPGSPRAGRLPRSPKEAATMTKSRQDNDVMGQPYLAQHLRRLGAPATAETLFRVAELPVADFYKQLAWEVDQGHVKDNQTTLEPGHAAG